MVRCGVDMIEIDRIKKSMQNPRFLKRCFTGAELAMFEKRKNAPQTVAVNFAAKEAMSKALGTGVRNFSLRDIEVLRDGMGKPFVNLYGSLAHFQETCEMDISLSHNKTQAIAVIVVVKQA